MSEIVNGKEPMMNPMSLADGLLLSEQKELIDYLMEKQGLKPKVDVKRAWDNVVEIKRDQGS